MNLKNKRYTVRFYKSRCGVDEEVDTLWRILSELAQQNEPLQVMPAGDTAYQIRGLTVDIDMKSITGYLVRFRLDRPAVGSKSSLEEEYLELDEGKEFIEKNHFVLFKEREGVEVLGYQCSREGGVISVLSKYLTEFTEEKQTIRFDDILTKESLDVIFKKGLIKSVEFSVARPIGKEYQPDPEDAWTQDSFDMLTDVGGTKFTGKIAIASKQQGLLEKTKGYIRNLLNSEYTKKLKVKISGVKEPIDLFAERIYDKIDVPVREGGEIYSTDIYQGIKGVKDQKQHHFDANFKV
ncbi:hypothetical protein FE394_18030 [Xenorhabdus sp. Reich]|uniref:Phage protein n=1 Tax=Xenorhabdus littoralis TaxID=2582835 RepID=A0ABU4SQV8_9GAMM|nr:DUF6731 family protein [Xenorhabdus sp. Reich]MDX8001037.1 hypothetical protein [Xenorhabdus sp. Reich]